MTICIIGKYHISMQMQVFQVMLFQNSEGYYKHYTVLKENRLE